MFNLIKKILVNKELNFFYYSKSIRYYFNFKLNNR